MTNTLRVTQLIVLFFAFFISFSQNNTQPFNLDFETQSKEKLMPKNWFIWGNSQTYTIQTDSLNVHTGNYAAYISNNTEEVEVNSFTCIVYRIENKYVGKNIQLEGYIKTSNVEDGRAGLLMRLNNGNQMLGFNNMEGTTVDGTRDWQKYSISLPLNQETQIINIGGTLIGKGEAWFDNFTLSIDGKPIENLKKIKTEKKLAKAVLDKEFAYGSKFSISKDLSDKQIENLYTLCKKWGQLKYHNSKVANGDYNWDYELFRMLPSVKSPEFDIKLNQWSETLEKLDTFDITSHYYIDFQHGIGNPIFKHEEPYRSLHFGDTGMRLLALFRYWNMIEYFFPYKDLIDKSWNEVLKAYIPRVVNNDTELSFKLTILQLIGEISDTHANIWQSDKTLREFHGTRMAPIEIQFISDLPVVSALAENWDENLQIKTGDIITAINGKPVELLIKEKIKYSPASNYITQLNTVARRLVRANDHALKISFINDTGAFTETLNTYTPNEISFPEHHLSHKELKNDIGYIYPGTLEKDEIHEIMERFMDKQGIIIDLRCYPSDFIVFKLGQYLMPHPIEFVKFSTTSLEHPGKFEFTSPVKVGTENPDYFKGKIAILINESTMSQAEYTAMALRKAPKAKVIGSQTAGADGNTSGITLPGNIYTMISGIGVYYPDGTQTQRIGIVPDIEIHPTVDGLRQDKDEVLERAIDYICSEANGK